MVETSLAIASKRDHRDFDPTPLAPALVRRILDAGRLAGSARNRQPWRFFVATDPAARARLAATVYVPALLTGAPLAVAIAVQTEGSGVSGVDAGRAAQNLMLAAWAEGIASCPNGIRDPGLLARELTLRPGEQVALILAFGRPARPRDPARRSREEWSRRANRRALADVVVSLDASDG